MNIKAAQVIVVDYGRGNLRSITKALAHVGAEANVSSDPADVAGAERLLLPGVGAFGDGMKGLKQRGLIEPIKHFCASNRPFLGICLGMQMLMTEGTEFGIHAGLGLVPGRAVRLPDQNGTGRFKVPHVGWNRLQAANKPASPGTTSPAGSNGWRGTLLDGGPPEPFMYFVHSYVADPTDPGHRLAMTRYGATQFCSAIAAKNIYGFQFHPEKSGEAGLALLKNWTLLPLP